MDVDSLTSRLRIDPPIDGSFTWAANTLTFTPDDPWPSGDNITVHLQPGAHSANFPRLTIREGLTWSFTVRQPLLAYLYPANAPADIYTIME